MCPILNGQNGTALGVHMATTRTRKLKAEPKEPRVYVVANLKGGVGKSSVAAHLACLLAEQSPVTAVDLDPGQGDLNRFAKLRGIETHIVQEADVLFDLVEALTGEGKSVVIDCPPGESPSTRVACYLADAVVMPVRPGANDAAAIGRLLSMVGEIRQERSDLQVFTLCNFFKNSNEAKMMVSLLQQMGVATYVGKLWDRKDYSFAIGSGKPVWETAEGKPAAEEMRSLCEALERMVS